MCNRHGNTDCKCNRQPHRLFVDGPGRFHFGSSKSNSNTYHNQHLLTDSEQRRMWYVSYVYYNCNGNPGTDGYCQQQWPYLFAWDRNTYRNNYGNIILMDRAGWVYFISSESCCFTNYYQHLLINGK